MNEILEEILEHARQIQDIADDIAQTKSEVKISRKLEDMFKELKWVFHLYRQLNEEISGSDYTWEDFLKDLKEEELKERYEERDEDL